MSNKKSLKSKRLEELATAKAIANSEKNTALIDYIAMMGDIELPVEEVNNNELVREDKEIL